MKVLIVTHNYAPDRAPRAFRWTAIAEYWAQAGVHVDVVTTGRAGNKVFETVNGVHVYRVGERGYGRFRRIFVTERPARDTPSRQRSGALAVAAKLGKLLYDATWKRLYWPDHAAFWYWAARRQALRLCRTHIYDSVITVSHPFTGHLIGLKLKKVFPNLRWIADVGDPFSLGGTVSFNNEPLYGTLNRWAEAQVYARCDAISVTVEGCRDAVAEIFADTKSKIEVIPPLLSLNPAPNAPARRNSDDTATILVYLGVLYARIRRPDALLALFSAMYERDPTFQLHFYGDSQGCETDFHPYTHLIGRAIFIHGPVPRDRVGSIMQAADILVNIGNETSYQLPSKLVEYASTGRPIMNISANRSDTTSDFLANYPAALSLVCADGTPSRDQIDQALRFAEGAEDVDSIRLEEFLSRFRIGPVADAYNNMIDPLDMNADDKKTHVKAQRILICSEGIPHPTDGASVVLFFHYIDRLKREGYRIRHLLLLSGDAWPNDAIRDYKDRMEESDRFTVEAIRTPRFYYEGRFRHRLDPILTREIEGAAKEFSPNLIVAFDLVAAWASKEIAIPRVVWLGDLRFQTQFYHALYSAKENPRAFLHLPSNWLGCQAWKRVYAAALRREDHIICASYSSIAEMARLGLPSVYEPYPWPETTTDESVPRDLERPRPTFLFFGSLSGLGSRSALHFTLEKIFPLLRRQWGANGFRILIAGKGDLPEWVSAAFADKPEIQRVGFVEDLDTLLSTCHGVLVPIDIPVGNRSRILTAMAKRALVIAHHNASLGNPTLVDGVTCYLANTATEFADRLCRAVDEPQKSKTIIDQAYRSYTENYAVNVATARLAERVRILIGGAGIA
jgi:glycosyltransferase involved in cell wall biosynthesis